MDSTNTELIPLPPKRENETRPSAIAVRNAIGLGLNGASDEEIIRREAAWKKLSDDAAHFFRNEFRWTIPEPVGIEKFREQIRACDEFRTKPIEGQKYLLMCYGNWLAEWLMHQKLRRRTPGSITPGSSATQSSSNSTANSATNETVSAQTLPYDPIRDV